MTTQTPGGPIDDALAARPPMLPYVERPWLLLHTVAVALGIGGSLLWRSLAVAPLRVEEIVEIAVAMFISVAVLIAPGLALRAARQAMRRLAPDGRRAVLRRLFATAMIGPLSACALWVALGANGWWWTSSGVEVLAMLALSAVLGLSGAIGLAMQYRH